MSTDPSTQDTIAAAEAMLAEVTRHLNATEDVVRSQLQTLQEFAEQYERDQEEELRGLAANGLQRARMAPALPAAEVAVDPVTLFSRQVWRRRNTV